MDEKLKVEGSPDIQEALREFEAKSHYTEAQKVSNIHQDSEIPKMVRLVMKFSGGAIKEQRTAEYVLLGFVVLTIIISLFLFFGGNSSSYKEKVIPAMPPAGVDDPNFQS